MNYLITPTLLNSFSYYMSEYGKREDFLKTLGREKFEPNEAMQKGIDFERFIELFSKEEISFVDGNLHVNTKEFTKNCPPKEYWELIKNIGQIVEKGVWQATVQKSLIIGDAEYLVYGKCDVIKENFIYDIKFTKNYEIGKFSSSIQHLIYMYCTGLTKFAYLISDGKEWWREDYQASKNIESEIKSRISEFRSYLVGDKEAENLYLTKWKSQ